MRTLRGLASTHGLHELVEQERRVRRPWHRLRMELDAHERSRARADALVRAVVEVPERGFPAGRQRRLVDSVAVILGGDEAARAPDPNARLILPAVAELELVRVGAGG